MVWIYIEGIREEKCQDWKFCWKKLTFFKNKFNFFKNIFKKFKFHTNYSTIVNPCTFFQNLSIFIAWTPSIYSFLRRILIQTRTTVCSVVTIPMKKKILRFQTRSMDVYIYRNLMNIFLFIFIFSQSMMLNWVCVCHRKFINSWDFQSLHLDRR